MDEADRILNMDFETEVSSAISCPLCKGDVQFPGGGDF